MTMTVRMTSPSTSNCAAKRRAKLECLGKRFIST